MAEAVSVVITCFNLEAYIGSCIDSVLDQTYPGELQIIVVDDCSTDQSRNIIAAYPRIELLALPINSGVMLATVAGIKAARHDLILFLDGDDVWLPGKVEKTVAAFAGAAHVAMVTHDLRRIDSDGRVSGGGIDRSRLPPMDAQAALSRWIKEGILFHRPNIWLGSAYAISYSRARLADFLKIVDASACSRQSYQDWPLAFWVASQDDVEFRYVDEVLFEYRVHGSNYSGDGVDAARMVRNLGKSLATHELIADVAVVRGVAAQARENNAHIVDYLNTAIALYEGRRGVVLARLHRVLPYLIDAPASRFKDLIRFVLILLLGVHASFHVKRLMSRKWR
jgi:glycosyltransferase involved in cell wall biosynthesis